MADKFLNFEKQKVADTMCRCYERFLTTATGGNISMRYNDFMLITPSGKDKSCLLAQDIAIVELSTGKNLTPELKLSIETEMHRACYLSRSDVNAVVHSHPTFASLFSACNEEINTTLIAESYYLLDSVIKVPYRLMGSISLAEIVGEYVKKGNALLLENHGVLCTGSTLIAAFDRLEVTEQAAKMTHLARSANLNINEISGKDLIDIANMR